MMPMSSIDSAISAADAATTEQLRRLEREASDAQRHATPRSATRRRAALTARRGPQVARLRGDAEESDASLRRAAAETRELTRRLDELRLGESLGDWIEDVAKMMDSTPGGLSPGGATALARRRGG